jgi:hypothetical protein
MSAEIVRALASRRRKTRVEVRRAHRDRDRCGVETSPVLRFCDTKTSTK